VQLEPLHVEQYKLFSNLERETIYHHKYHLRVLVLELGTATKTLIRFLMFSVVAFPEDLLELPLFFILSSNLADDLFDRRGAFAPTLASVYFLVDCLVEGF
jgi:hypothetical protein